MNLIAWRKLQAGIRGQGEKSVEDTLAHLWDNPTSFDVTSLDKLTVNDLTVKKFLKAPLGTDRYDVDAITGIEILRPNGSGDVEGIPFQIPSDGLNHYLKVDEVAADDDTTYVYGASTPGFAYDVYNLPATTLTGTIKKIIVTARFKRAAPGNPANVQYSAGIIIKTGGSYYGYGGVEADPQTDGGAGAISPGVVTTSWADYSMTWALNPQSGVAWTIADIDALQIGIKLRDCDSSIATVYTYCTQVYVTVYSHTIKAGYIWIEGADQHIINASNSERTLLSEDHTVATDPHTGYVLESLFGTHAIVRSIGSGTPTSLNITEQTLVGRVTGGSISALNGSQSMTILSGQAGTTFDFGSQSVTGIGGLTLLGSANLIIGTTTGTKIGTAITQLLGFYGAVPVDQPGIVVDPVGGVVVDAECRTAVIAVVDRLQELGLVA